MPLPEGCSTVRFATIMRQAGTLSVSAVDAKYLTSAGRAVREPG
jgi:hypothetical protein